MEFFPISKLLENQGLQFLVQDIFFCLDRDSIWNCRQVSKSWKDFIDNGRVLPILQLKALKETERHQKLLGTFQEWREVFELIEASELPKLQKCIGILKKYREVRTSYISKTGTWNILFNQSPNDDYTTYSRSFREEEFTGIYFSYLPTRIRNVINCTMYF